MSQYKDDFKDCGYDFEPVTEEGRKMKRFIEENERIQAEQATKQPSIKRGK